MNKIHYAIILVCLLSVTGCGVRRDLRLPEQEKHSSYSNEMKPDSNHNGAVLD